jgi:hypothetical protein
VRNDALTRAAPGGEDATRKEEVSQRIMLANAQRSEAVERRIVAEDSLARAELT